MNENDLILSVVIPFFNDKYYIEECLESVITNDSNDLEILISDDHSDDNSLELIKSFKDRRIRIITTPEPVGAVKNWSFALQNAIGKYVYFLAGDDYLSPGILDKIIPELDGVSMYTAPMNCFDDNSGKIIERHATQEKFNQMFDDNKKLSYQFQNWMNHDELVLSFFIREKLLIVDKLVPYSTNSVLWYWVFIAFHDNKVKNLIDTVLFKRCNHKYKRAYWTTIRSKTLLPASIIRSYIFQSLGDIYNSIVISKHFNSLGMLVRFLFFPQRNRHKSGGFFGIFSNSEKCYYKPGMVFLFLFSIPISILRFLRKIMVTD